MHKYTKALVLGCGRSGMAAEALLRTEGTEALVLDESTCDFSSFKSQVSSFQPPVAVISPGFSLEHPWVKDLMARGIPLLSELELGWSRRHCPVIAVTGSNGKSTVVKWIADALAHVGKIAVPCGNYGLPVSAAVRMHEVPDWLVIEVSSFQLETMEQFHPDIGVLLNVLPNHLDRHGDMETYRALKLRLFECMQQTGTAILPFNFTADGGINFQALEPAEPGLAANFQALEKCGEKVPDLGNQMSRSIPAGSPRSRTSATEYCRAGAETPPFESKTFGVEEGADYRFQDGKVGEIDLTGTYFDNEVLGAAAAGVAAVADACGLPAGALEASARTFEPLPHRMQTVAEINGVTFIDDSKATNLAGMCAALRMVLGPIHLIAGGRAKETNLSFAKDLLAQHVSRLYLIGEASEAMHAAWGNSVECLPCETLEAAVSAASESARAGDTVLLSPACTSFDQFRSFSERGEVFARELGRLKSECAEGIE